MDDLKILIVGDVSASKFFHVPKFWIHSRCPNCGKIATIKPFSDSESLSDDLNKAVGYAKIGVCSRCQKKMLVGFKIWSPKLLASSGKKEFNRTTIFHMLNSCSLNKRICSNKIRFQFSTIPVLACREQLLELLHFDLGTCQIWLVRVSLVQEPREVWLKQVSWNHYLMLPKLTRDTYGFSKYS